MENTGIGYLIWEKIPRSCLTDHKIKMRLDCNKTATDSKYENEIQDCKQQILRNITELKARQISSVRIGVSWAEWVTPGGKEFICWYLNRYAENGFDILPNLVFTPPPLGVEYSTNSPPKDPFDYTIFVNDVCSTCGKWFDKIELWNEWNLETDWLLRLDPELKVFTVMIAMGALVGKYHKKKIVLGGMAGLNKKSIHFFKNLVRLGLMDYLDVVGLHHLRGTWSDTVPPRPLEEDVERLRRMANKKASRIERLRLSYFIDAFALSHGGELGSIILEELRKIDGINTISVWVTEYGFSTYDGDYNFTRTYLEEIQAALFSNAFCLVKAGKIERVYWYTLQDQIFTSLRKITTGWEDILQYFYGDRDLNGNLKLLGKLLLEGGPVQVFRYIDAYNLYHLVDEASINRGKPVDYIPQDHPLFERAKD